MTKTPYDAPVRLDDAAAIRFARPAIEILADEPSAQALADLAAVYYGFWNTEAERCSKQPYHRFI